MKEGLTAKAPKSLAMKVAKQAREAALLEYLAAVPSAEIHRRLVAQTNDSQSVYHALRRMVDREGVVAATAEQIALHTQTSNDSRLLNSGRDSLGVPVFVVLLI